MMKDFAPPLLIRIPKCLSVQSHTVVVPRSGGFVAFSKMSVSGGCCGTDLALRKRLLHVAAAECYVTKSVERTRSYRK